MSVKLTDAQLVMMSAAAQREDRCFAAPETMKGAVVSPLNAALWRLRRRGRGCWVISLDFTCVWTRRVGSGLEPEFGVGRVWG